MSDLEGGSSGMFPTPEYADNLAVGDFNRDQTAVARDAQIDANLPTNVREYPL